MHTSSARLHASGGLPSCLPHTHTHTLPAPRFTQPPDPLPTHTHTPCRPCMQNGDTPLHLASNYGQVEVAHLLLQRGAAVNARNEVRLYA